jgi:hypothetical protein
LNGKEIFCVNHRIVIQTFWKLNCKQLSLSKNSTADEFDKQAKPVKSESFQRFGDRRYCFIAFSSHWPVYSLIPRTLNARWVLSKYDTWKV